MKPTPEDVLVAGIVVIKNITPGGYQVAIGLRIAEAMRQIEQFWPAHKLPMQSELMAELTLWRTHAEEGVRLMQHSYNVIDAVIRSVSKF